jgi:hypothetical protein
VIPGFNDEGTLPEGIHYCSWTEFKLKFGYNDHRRNLLSGLHQALINLKYANCKILYIDGSFVTNKQYPNDFDACWDHEGVKLSLLDPTFLDFQNKRAKQKLKFRGEFFLAKRRNGTSNISFLEFFQLCRENGKKKGIIALNLVDFNDKE